jgi:hypothetical protein
MALSPGRYARLLKLSEQTRRDQNETYFLCRCAHDDRYRVAVHWQRGRADLQQDSKPLVGSAPLTVVYTYTFDNSQGARRLDSVDTPVDDACSPVVFQGGDSNPNHMLDVGEIWTWTCTTVINATTVNTAQTSASFTICSGNTCSTTILDFITAHATVSIMPAPLTVSISGRKSVCKNDLVTLTADVAGGTPPLYLRVDQWCDESSHHAQHIGRWNSPVRRHCNGPRREHCLSEYDANRRIYLFDRD